MQRQVHLLPSDLRSTNFHESPNYRTASSGHFLCYTQIDQGAWKVQVQIRLLPSVNHDVTEPRLHDKHLLRTYRQYRQYRTKGLVADTTCRGRTDGHVLHVRSYYFVVKA